MAPLPVLPLELEPALLEPLELELPLVEPLLELAELLLVLDALAALPLEPVLDAVELALLLLVALELVEAPVVLAPLPLALADELRAPEVDAALEGVVTFAPQLVASRRVTAQRMKAECDMRGLANPPGAQPS